MASRVAALLGVLLGLIAAGADQCVFRKGRCSYQLQMSETCDESTVANEMQSDDNPTKGSYFASERSEQQQQRLISDLEKKFSAMLDNVNSACAKKENAQRAQAYAGKRNAQYNRKTSQKNENHLMSRLHKEFRALRSALASARRRLRKSERHLVTTQAKLNRSVAGTKELGKLLLTSETNLVNTQRDNAQLKRDLHDRNRELNSTQYRLNATEAELEETKRRAQDLEVENKRLRAELKSCRTELEMTRMMLERALKKYHELNVRHANTTRQLDAARLEIVECYRGKTTQFCGFEDEQICGFYKESNETDTLDWSRSNGATPSSDTGPSTDHTCGNKFGHYMYVEATTGKANNLKALLTSPYFRGMDDQCVEFYYHMYGRHIGTLNVFSYVDDTEFSPLWRAYGNQGNVWSTARMTIPRHVAQKGYKVVFEAALLRTGYQGDIAIDDFRVTDGKCVRPTRDASQIGPQRRTTTTAEPDYNGGAT